MLPLNDLYLPILPFETNGKFLFSLCGKCAHTDKERFLENTQVILEVIKALKLGYKILKIYKILHFLTREKYNTSNKS
jgi:hypothetical protein